MDLKTIAQQTRLYNFHSHTQFCDGRADMDQFIHAAVEAGFLHYGFTPHSPLVGVESSCNMDINNVDAYFDTANRLKAEYKNRMNIYIGMEVDYLNEECGPAAQYIQAMPLDYRIGSVHFIPSDHGFIDIDGRFENFRKKVETYFSNDIRYVVESFYRQSTRMIEAGGFDILGHFDKIGHNASHFKAGIENEAWYKQLVNNLIDLIIEKKLTIELNTKAWTDHRRTFPGERYLARLAEGGVAVLVNSDAHYPELINASRDVGFDMLARNGYSVPD